MESHSKFHGSSHHQAAHDIPMISHVSTFCHHRPLKSPNEASTIGTIGCWRKLLVTGSRSLEPAFHQHHQKHTLLTWGWVKTLVPSEPQNSWDLWMFIPLRMVLIGIDPYPCGNTPFVDHFPSLPRVTIVLIWMISIPIALINPDHTTNKMTSFFLESNLFPFIRKGLPKMKRSNTKP